ncbi:MAG TPA: hypothetical protein VNJ54_08400, partial [Plantibacter sp.]|uniref:hypothetical protein n=1 Tax=Plantibacter sp. TaxID=1871045 RepID=UPI002CCF6D21|nr:hypothetical protein [Plantibacter sp.]
ELVGADVVTKKRRQRDIERCDAAVANVKQSTVEVAAAIRECQADEAWLDDEDFRHAQAGGRIDLADAANRSYLAAWTAFRYGFSRSYTFYMAKAGEVLEVLGASTNVDALPTAEGQLRKLTKALNPVYVATFGEVEDDNARNEAIQRIWQRSLRQTDGDVAAAVKAFGHVAKDDPFEPLARRFRESGRTPAEQAELRDKMLEQFRNLGLRLLRAGRRVEVQRIVDELLRQP